MFKRKINFKHVVTYNETAHYEKPQNGDINKI